MVFPIAKAEHYTLAKLTRRKYAMNKLCEKLEQTCSALSLLSMDSSDSLSCMKIFCKYAPKC
jgi:hypothetical protein